MISYSQYVGDGVVRTLGFDFANGRTELLLERWGAGGAAENITLVFAGVAFQQFRDFEPTTVLLDLEEAKSWAEFMTVSWYPQYVEQRQNYLSDELLNHLATAATHRYFLLTSSCGFEALVICQQLQLSNLPEQLNP